MVSFSSKFEVMKLRKNHSVAGLQRPEAVMFDYYFRCSKTKICMRLTGSTVKVFEMHAFDRISCSLFRCDQVSNWILSVVCWSYHLDSHLSDISRKLGRNWRQNFICHTTWSGMMFGNLSYSL